MVNAERAWIIATDIGKLPDFTPDPTKVEILWINVPFKNFGKTPARVVRAHIRAHQIAIGEKLPPEPEYQSADALDFILPGTVDGQLSVGLSASDFIEIWESKKILYLYGFIDYIDVGNIKRQARFCYRYNIPAGFNPNPRGFAADFKAPQTYTKCT